MIYKDDPQREDVRIGISLLYIIISYAQTLICPSGTRKLSYIPLVRANSHIFLWYAQTLILRLMHNTPLFSREMRNITVLYAYWKRCAIFLSYAQFLILRENRNISLCSWEKCEFKVKYLRAGPAEMPFQTCYTADTNHFIYLQIIPPDRGLCVFELCQRCVAYRHIWVRDTYMSSWHLQIYKSFPPDRFLSGGNQEHNWVE